MSDDERHVVHVEAGLCSGTFDLWCTCQYTAIHFGLEFVPLEELNELAEAHIEEKSR